jgi:MFS family permease
MLDYTNRLNALKARRRASAATAIILFVLGLLLTGFGAMIVVGGALSEHYEEVTPGEVLFWIGASLLVIGFILFIVTATISYEIKELKRESAPEAELNKDKMPADSEKRRRL